MAIRNTFKAYERLKRKQDIDALFRTGKAFSIFPIRIIYLIVPQKDAEISSVKAGFSVSKKKYKKAVDRNRVKRLMREAWRLNKHTLYKILPTGKQLHVFLIFTDSILPDYAAVNMIVQQGMEKIASTLQH